MTTRYKLLAIAALAATAGSQAASAQVTDINEIVLYGINNDAPVELVRYTFDTDTYSVVGRVRDQNGNIPPEMEAFTYIPAGPNKGFYASSNYDGWNRSRLVKVDALEAIAEAYTSDIGFGFVVGMTAYFKGAPDNEWAIYATHRGKVNNLGPNVTNLISIDPATGVGELVQPIVDAPATAYQGLTLGPDGLLYGVTNIPKTTLWTINPATGVETLVGELSNSNMKVEALEWAFGDYAPPSIDVPGIDPLTWTSQGCLFAFSDINDQFMVLNPSTAAWVVYPCSFAATDAEGLAFFTLRTDPRYAVDEGYD